MTPADPLTVLLDRACRGALNPDEAAALRAAVHQLRQQLAALHEGEEPYEDERIVPTPGQWIWQWNRATPQQRLAKAAQVLDMHDRLDLVRQALLCYSDRPDLADAMRAALDGRSPDVQVKQACDHRDPNRLGMRRDLATICAGGHLLFPPIIPASPQTPEPRTHNSHIWEDEDGWHVSCEHYNCPDSSRDVGSEYDAEEWAEQHRAEATSSQAPR